MVILKSLVSAAYEKSNLKIDSRSLCVAGLRLSSAGLISALSKRKDIFDLLAHIDFSNVRKDEVEMFSDIYPSTNHGIHLNDILKQFLKSGHIVFYLPHENLSITEHSNDYFPPELAHFIKFANRIMDSEVSDKPRFMWGMNRVSNDSLTTLQKVFKLKNCTEEVGINNDDFVNKIIAHMNRNQPSYV